MPFEMDSTISIHSPREGGDCDKGGETMTISISIHAPPRGGATGHYYCSECAETSNFNPRPPRGGRHASFEQSENA